MRQGAYYLRRADRVVAIYDVENYEDLAHEFSIVTWEDEAGIHRRVLITSDQYSYFFRLGNL